MALSKLDIKDRFNHISDDNLREKHIKVQKKNTKKNDKAAERQFRDYLAFKECAHTRFWEFSKEDLDDHLSRFWFSTRQNKIDETTNQPKKYCVQTMKTMRYALNRVLRENGIGFDIITDSSFRKSQIAFSDCCKELKEEGYGFIKPTDEIIPEGTIKHCSNSLFTLFFAAWSATILSFFSDFYWLWCTLCLLTFCISQ